MIAAAHLLAHLCGRLGFGFAVLVLALWAGPAAAVTLDVDRDLCHARSAATVADGSLSTLRFSCRGTPAGYQQASLWLRAPLDGADAKRGDIALMVHQSRFDRLAVAFSYADGTTRWQKVRSGDYGPYWRAGGQILFEAPERNAALTAVTMRFDRLSGHQFVHARIVPKAEAGMQSTGMAAAVGAALTLLLVSCIYSLSLAFAVRRQYLAWQAAWSGAMLLWGTLWSQVHLALVPGLAGTVTTQICTFLSCLAIALATVSAATAVDRGRVPEGLRTAVLALGLGVGIAGIPLALIRGSILGALADVLGLMVIADLLAVTVYVGWAWRAVRSRRAISSRRGGFRWRCSRSSMSSMSRTACGAADRSCSCSPPRPGRRCGSLPPRRAGSGTSGSSAIMRAAPKRRHSNSRAAIP